MEKKIRKNKETVKQNNRWLTSIHQKVRKFLEKKTGRWLFSEKEFQDAEKKLTHSKT